MNCALLVADQAQSLVRSNGCQGRPAELVAGGGSVVNSTRCVERLPPSTEVTPTSNCRCGFHSVDIVPGSSSRKPAVSCHFNSAGVKQSGMLVRVMHSSTAGAIEIKPPLLNARIKTRRCMMESVQPEPPPERGCRSDIRP